MGAMMRIVQELNELQQQLGHYLGVPGRDSLVLLPMGTLLNLVNCASRVSLWEPVGDTKSEVINDGSVQNEAPGEWWSL